MRKTTKSDNIQSPIPLDRAALQAVVGGGNLDRDIIRRVVRSG